MDKEPVIISMCSLGIPCQYRPRSYRRKIVDKYMKKYFLIPLCPEQLGGLSTPRTACHLEECKIQKIDCKGLIKYEIKVIGNDGQNYTEQYIKGANLALKIAQMYNIKKAYLKKNSPSCGKGGITRKLFEKNGIVVYQI